MNRLHHALIALAVLLAGGGIAFWIFKNPRRAAEEPRRAAPPVVRVIEAAPRSHRVIVPSQGTVNPRTRTTLVAEVAGRVVSVAPAWAEGGFFEEGGVLLRIDSSDYDLAVVSAKAEVAQAELRLARELEEAEIARREWREIGKPESEPSPLVLREPQVKEARAALEAARARQRQAELDLERTEVRAPFAGRVLERSADVGQYVARGSTVGRIYAVDYAEVRLPVTVDDLAFLDVPLRYRGEGRIDAGLPVTLHARFAGEEHSWGGEVVRTEGEIDPRTRMVHLVARVEDPYGRGDDPERPPLAVGLFVRAEIAGRVLDDVIVLPRHVLRRGEEVLVADTSPVAAPPERAPSDSPPSPAGALPQAEAREAEAHLPAGRLRFHPVEVLRYEGELVLVRAATAASGEPGAHGAAARASSDAPREGLRPGELVVVSPIATVIDGMPVRVLEEEAP